MSYSIIVATPYFIYVSNHSNYCQAMMEFTTLLEIKKEHKTKFKIALKQQSQQPIAAQ